MVSESSVVFNINNCRDSSRNNKKNITNIYPASIIATVSVAVGTATKNTVAANTRQEIVFVS